MTIQELAQAAASRYYPDGSFPAEELAVARDAYAKGYIRAWTVGKEAEAALARWQLIEKLRAGDASSVTILCENTDRDDLPDHGVECFGEWTGWRDKRFYGNTVMEALSEASKARQQEEGAASP